jgi:CRP/FNR family transcriptional regulator, anaerobic regulatory protein
MKAVTISTRPKAAAARALCTRCEVRNACFGRDVDADGLRQLDQVIERRFRLSAGENLYRIGDPFKSLYAIRSGYLKTSIRDDRGQQQVVGLHMKGDVVGVGGLESHFYIFEVSALTPCELCEIPFDKLEALARGLPQLRRNMVKMFALYLNRDSGTHALRRKGNAETRLAGFLLDFSRRLAVRGSDPACFSLPATREDIGSHLGLNSAAVSRAFARLNELGLAKASRRTIEVTDSAGLQSLAASRD